jgi:hypothetical protein
MLGRSPEANSASTTTPATRATVPILAKSLLLGIAFLYFRTMPKSLTFFTLTRSQDALDLHPLERSLAPEVDEATEQDQDRDDRLNDGVERQGVL